MGKSQSPLLGYNTNVRHKGRVFHIQTEDSGIQKPHVITHLFADGGRIVKSQKTSYAHIVDADDLATQVKKLMQEQHKAMFLALREGQFDAQFADEPAPEAAVATVPDAGPLIEAAAEPTPERASAPPPTRAVPPPIPAAARESATPPPPPPAARASTRAVPLRASAHPAAHERTLDEVILEFLARELGETA
ncbi:MAG: hypothetical protein R3A52_08470 [Polyangiales bacterium]